MPFIGQVLGHWSFETGGALPISIPANARGSIPFGRFLARSKDGDHFRARLNVCIHDRRLPKIVHAFAQTNNSPLTLDEANWVAALGESQRHRYQELQRSIDRCRHLLSCFSELVQALGFPSPESIDVGPLPSPVDMGSALPSLKALGINMMSVMATSFAIGELVKGEIVPNAGVRPEIAQALLESLSAVESFVFNLVSSLSTLLNAGGDPVVTAILRDEDLFRRSFDADTSRKFTLAQLDDELSEP
jgi:hypothetical protein